MKLQRKADTMAKATRGTVRRWRTLNADGMTDTYLEGQRDRARQWTADKAASGNGSVFGVCGRCGFAVGAPIMDDRKPVFCGVPCAEAFYAEADRVRRHLGGIQLRALTRDRSAMIPTRAEAEANAIELLFRFGSADVAIAEADAIERTFLL